MITTLAHALTASSQSITLFDDVDLESGQLLALGSEYCRVLRVLTPTQALVQRGVNGTQARVQEAGITVTVGVPDDFLTGPQSVPVFGDDTDVLTANGPSFEATYQVSGGSGGGDTVIVDGVDNTIKATVRDYLASNPLAVVLTDTDGNAYVANNDVGSDVNINGIGGVTPLVGNGVTGTGSLRVTIASNNTPFHTIIDSGSTTVVTGTVAVSAASLPLPALASTSTKQSDGSQKTQVVDGSGNVIGSTSNALDVNIKSGAGSGGTAIADEATFTQGTTQITPIGGLFQSAYTALTTGQAGVLRVTSGGSAYTNLDQVQGTNVDVNSGNKSAGTLRVVLATDQPALTNKLLVTPDLPAGASTAAKQPALGTAGTASADVITVQGIASMTPLAVTVSAGSAVMGHVITDTGSTTAVTGNVTVVQGTAASLNAAVVGTGTAGTAAGGVLTVQGVASMTKLLVTPDSVALPANQSVNVSQINAVTPLMGNGTTGTGSQRVTIASDNTAFSVNPLSATTPVSTMNSASANSGVNSAMAAVFDDSSPTSITENSFGFVRMSANRNQYATIRDAAGNERGLNVDANGAIAVTATNATAANLNAAVVGTGTAGSAAGGVLTIQGVASMTKLLVTPDSVALPANQSVNVAQMNGVTVTMGTGNSGTGVQRVVLATDQPQLTNKLLVTPDANSAINLAQVNGTTTVNGGSAAGILAVGGPNATNVAITGNPVNNGAQAVSSENAAVTTARQVQLVADLVGKLIVLPYANPENFVSGAITSAMTGTTTTSLIAAPASGLRNYITQITVSNSHATVGTDIIIQDGSGGTTLYTIPAAATYGGATLTFPTPLRQPTTATAIYCANVTTGASTKVSASGYKGA